MHSRRTAQVLRHCNKGTQHYSLRRRAFGILQTIAIKREKCNQSQTNPERQETKTQSILQLCLVQLNYSRVLEEISLLTKIKKVAHLRATSKKKESVFWLCRIITGVKVATNIAIYF